jgi:hypothetical protein
MRPSRYTWRVQALADGLSDRYLTFGNTAERTRTKMKCAAEGQEADLLSHPCCALTARSLTHYCRQQHALL